MIQIGFLGVSIDALISSIDNGPAFEGPLKVSELIPLGYQWEDEYLFIDIDENDSPQVLNLVDSDPIESVPFSDHRPL